MKKILLFSCLLLASTAFAADAPRKIAFQREDDTVWVANLEGSGAKKIAHGVDPDISPDGTKLAFNTEDKSSPARHIAVADLATGKVTVFKDVPSDNCFGPVWAPDSAKLLFYILDQNWDIGLANADGSGFRILKKAGPNGTSFFSACWMPDGQTLFCQDLENLCQIGLDGAVIDQWPLQKLFPKGDMDSSMRFDVSPDGKTLLVDLEIAADAGIDKEGGGYPPPSIWALDLAAETARRLSPPDWSQPCWLTAEEYLFTGQGPRDKEPSIYRASLGAKTRKLVIKNASDPSVSK